MNEEGDRRNKETLLPLIQKFIRPGSVIYSDCWPAYKDISNLGNTHHEINHSESFVKGQIHTQNIERLWRDIKE